MNYFLAIFHSQTQTYEFYRILLKYGVRATVVQTPNQIGKTCGLSVKIPNRFGLESARVIISKGQFSSFFSFFEVIEFGPGNKQIKQI